MATLISRSEAETEALGETWAKEARPGWVIGLTGDLGTGKTRLVRGLARGLGFEGRVHSPTFSLLNEYQGGRLPLFHLDLYRLSGPEEVSVAGLEDYLYTTEGLAVVEWFERWWGGSIPDSLGSGRKAPAAEWRSGLPDRLRWARFEALGAQVRRVIYDDLGA